MSDRYVCKLWSEDVVSMRFARDVGVAVDVDVDVDMDISLRNGE